tara:strand:+ start:1632 stop:1946 length:315 start_codon:yes stop_codon:yes gene_type:complete
MNDHWQDWTPIVIKKNPTKPSPKPTKPKELDEIGKVQPTTLELRKQIQNSRMAKKMSQAELAKLINEKPNIIQGYENGKAVPDHKVLQKLRRVLGVKLTPPPKN